ncbi:MAG: SH3 domain-containing protein, partial [Spirochaetales bacterium]
RRCYARPSLESSRLWQVEAGTIVMPVDEKEDWYEVFVRSRYATGWIRKSDTLPALDPRWPMPREPRNN